MAVNTQLDERIQREQIRLIYNQGSILVLGATLCAALVALFLWRLVPQNTLLLWLAAVCIGTVLRISIIQSYQRSTTTTRQRPYWGKLFWVGTLLSGLIWGSWPLLFYNLYSTEHLLLISTIFAGMVAVSASAGNIYLPSFYSFSVPLVVPMSIAHFQSANDSLVLTGVLLLMFLGVNSFLANRGNSQYRELLRARFEIQELMERLEQEKNITDRAVIAKSRFLAAASHDLRQPLHALGLFLRALRNREVQPRQLNIIADMSKSIEALNGLFNSLLDVSRLDAEIIDFNPRHVLVGDLFAGLRAQFKHQCEQKGLSLVVKTSDCVLYIDNILLERVLRNLLSNAIQYTRRGEICLSCMRQSPGHSLITVSDTGIGIPADESVDVFSEFYQLNNPERDRGKGLGLGLAIVKRLCDLMDLELHMHSELGTGTRFQLRVPTGNARQLVQLRTHSMIRAPAAKADGICVLVIDDEPQVLQSMGHTLEDWGFAVLLAETARDALKVLALGDASPDIILSDYRLRGNCNGVDAVAVVREAVEKELPAVIITGDTSPERLKEVSESNLQILHKPVNPDELLLALENLTAQAQTDVCQDDQLAVMS